MRLNCNSKSNKALKIIFQISFVVSPIHPRVSLGNSALRVIRERRTRMDKITKSAVAVLFVFGLLLLLPLDALAVPSFQRQTGYNCAQCHTVFPELTPFGRAFKMGGYVLTKAGKQEQWVPPIAAMVQASYTEQKGLSNKVDPFDDSPDAKTNLPQQASLFYAGKIIDHLGAFSQLTYDGVSNNLFLDNTDIRYANSVSLGDTNLVYGATLNNNPTVQDVWNTTPAWRFPWATSAVAVTPAASPVINGVLAQQVGGIGVYGFWNDLIYGEVALYRSNQKGLTRPLSAGTTVSPVTNNEVPYWRLALQHQWGPNSLEVGTYGIVADIYPGDATSGQTDRFIDTAFDAQYQYISGKHIFSLQSTWIHENQIWNASFPLGNTSNRSDFLNTFRGNANYYYKSSIGTIGGILGYFTTTGSTDPVLYAPQETTGSQTGSPNSNGFILEAVYMPWDKWKFALQYTIYNKFNGAHTNYDGFGRNASDNNTLYALVWIAF